MDNVRAYRASNLTEKHYLDFAAHDLLMTARNTEAINDYGLVGLNFSSKLLLNLPSKPVSLEVADHFLSALRERCFADVPGMMLLGASADVDVLIDVHRRYGSTNVYGATDPTPTELNQAAIHFGSVLDDYVRMARLSPSAADDNAFDGIIATAEAASASFPEICSSKVTRDIQSGTGKLHEAASTPKNLRMR